MNKFYIKFNDVFLSVHTTLDYAIDKAVRLYKGHRDATIQILNKGEIVYELSFGKGY